eukprot:1079868-Rhodomonas_salina.1
MGAAGQARDNAEHEGQTLRVRLLYWSTSQFQATQLHITPFTSSSPKPLSPELLPLPQATRNSRPRRQPPRRLLPRPGQAPIAATVPNTTTVTAHWHCAWN